MDSSLEFCKICQMKIKIEEIGNHFVNKKGSNHNFYIYNKLNLVVFAFKKN